MSAASENVQAWPPPRTPSRARRAFDPYANALYPGRNTQDLDVSISVTISIGVAVSASTSLALATGCPDLSSIATCTFFGASSSLTIHSIQSFAESAMFFSSAGILYLISTYVKSLGKAGEETSPKGVARPPTSGTHAEIAPPSSSIETALRLNYYFVLVLVVHGIFFLADGMEIINSGWGMAVKWGGVVGVAGSAFLGCLVLAYYKAIKAFNEASPAPAPIAHELLVF